MEQYSRDIEMTFGTDKCRLNSFKYGKCYGIEDFPMRVRESKIISIESEEQYKYLMIETAKEHLTDIRTG